MSRMGPSLCHCNPNRTSPIGNSRRRSTVTHIKQDTAMSEQVSNEDNGAPAMTRRAALAAAAVAPLSIGPAPPAEPVAQLVARAAEKNAAFMRGDMQRWSELVRIAADFTLMQPFGGPPSRGFDMSPVRMAERGRACR